MNIKRRLKYLTSCLLVSAFFWINSSAWAGGPEIPPSAPWVIYLGGFGGIYVANFEYQGTYLGGSFTVPIGSNVHQNGYTAGGHIGLRYYFSNPWFLGLEFAAMGNSENATTAESVLAPSPDDLIFNLVNQFRIKSNLDLTAQLGVNITPQTRVYIKGGASYARIRHILTVFNPATLTPTISLQRTTHKNRWGFLVGFGLGYDFCPWFGIFTEYNYYDYGRVGLDSLSNIRPNNGADTYHQNVRVHAYSVLLGVNLNFSV
ncbi:outer membrane protein [Coxiella burnetii]|uniref:Uncharacterized protein CBU_1413 n=1 Tax=Coxiella burnetii (strain RSA 493 / Nine Mile phase I) TaxID=227377 RepID=Y1413_COXBU|nr:outer membrane beta-barrel protein [Coxiella burnetii]NP_820397.1 membrane-spanning protein [Coxiella burnetii RSA 493]Q83BT9.1 RecName: Full=Uncharacterized protein CBU_1413; Flags: Precursor [Coxiella burnetii RSA 493]AAO90911.1 hypothetical exported membrane spanning protein [Coxiella burnetii RSA 493]ARI66192.1 hypothetical protein B7L74_07275 [Coxiella burnetii]ARK27648.1 hypothetical protein BMW92_07075 [Coxiella burnetii]MCF2093348.1 porin family protein [Coxiella burnetii]MCF20958